MDIPQIRYHFGPWYVSPQNRMGQLNWRLTLYSRAPNSSISIRSTAVQLSVLHPQTTNKQHQHLRAHPFATTWRPRGSLQGERGPAEYSEGSNAHAEDREEVIGNYPIPHTRGHN